MFAQKLERLLEERNIQQLDLAKYLNVQTSTVSQWKTGKREPDLKTINRIANFFNVPIGYLVQDQPLLSNKEIKKSLLLEEEINRMIDGLSEEDKKEAMRYINYLRYTSKGEDETSATLEEGSK